MPTAREDAVFDGLGGPSYIMIYATLGCIFERLAQLKGLPLPQPLVEQVDTDSYRARMALLIVPGLLRYRLKQARLATVGIRT